MVNAITASSPVAAQPASSSPQAEKAKTTPQNRTAAPDTVSISSEGQKLSQTAGKDGDADAS
jgi:hypothetical protein